MPYRWRPLKPARDCNRSKSGHEKLLFSFAVPPTLRVVSLVGPKDSISAKLQIKVQKRRLKKATKRWGKKKLNVRAAT